MCPAEINVVLASGVDNQDHEAVEAALSPAARDLFSSMPLSFKYELLLERDPHGNVQVGCRVLSRTSSSSVSFWLAEHDPEDPPMTYSCLKMANAGCPHLQEKLLIPLAKHDPDDSPMTLGG